MHALTRFGILLTWSGLIAMALGGSLGCESTPATSSLGDSPDDFWPHGFQVSREYDMVWSSCSETLPELYPSAEDVPPLPSMDILYEDLTGDYPCVEATRNTGFILTYFERESTVGDDIKVHPLHVIAQSDRGYPFIPFVLRGHNLEISGDGIVAYAEDPDAVEITWVYLTDELGAGTEVSTPIVSPQGDTWTLHYRIQRRLGTVDGSGNESVGIEIVYLVDMGIEGAVNESGVMYGFMRSYSYGVIEFHRGKGPVSFQERMGWTRSLDPQPGGLVVARKAVGILAD